MSEIKSRLLDAVKVAMRAQDKPRLTTLRLALADIKRVEVDERIEVDDARALLILDRMIKQRRDAQRQFSDAGRQEMCIRDRTSPRSRLPRSSCSRTSCPSPWTTMRSTP